MTINFEAMYNSLKIGLSGSQKKINVDSAISVYCGISKDGYYRIAFLSSIAAPKIQSTKILRVTQGNEASDAYWTCFDLLEHDIKKVFFTFSANLIEVITNVHDEQRALNALKKRYIIWKTMFKQESKVNHSKEVVQGLYGELYFMKNYMLERFGATISIQAWSGPEAKSKDYSVDTEWFEIKTIGANISKVQISSLSQLSSDNDGHLVVIKTEAMSNQFSNGESSIGELFDFIFAKINDEIIEEIFLRKISSYNFHDSDFLEKFEVKSMSLYKVDKNFPRLVEKDIFFAEICDVTYSLTVNSLESYLEG